MAMILYNCRHDGDQHRVTKFTDGEVEGSYLVTHSECDCPAGSRPTCRHRQMLPDLLPIIDTHWFWNFDTHTVVDLMGTPKATLDALIAPIVCAPAEQDTEARMIDEDDIEIFEPSAAYANGSPVLAGVNARDVTPATTGQHTVAEGLPPEQTVRASPAWRRL